MRHAIALLALAACSSSNPPDPDPISDAAVDTPPPEHASNLEVFDARATELSVRWTRGLADSGRYWLTYAIGIQPPASCAVPGATSLDLHDVAQTTISGLSAVSSYAFRLCAVDEAAGALTIDAGITTVGATLALPPGEPTNLHVVQSAPGTFDVSWAAGTGATAYVVTFAEGTTAPADCFTGSVVHTTGQFVELATLATNRTYAVRVCSQNANPTPDLSAGVTSTEFMHSPLAADPTALTTTTLDAEWVKLGWTGTGSEFRIAIATTGTPDVGCTTATTSTVRSSQVLTNLSPSTSYQVRICTSNGDSQPLLSDGRVLSFQTPRRTEPFVNGLTCVDPTDPDLAWTGPGPGNRFAIIRSAANGTVAPPCTNTQSLINAQFVNGTWRVQAPGQIDESFVVRVCFLKSDGTFDQGQAMAMTMPRNGGQVLLPASCTPQENLVEPTLTMSATTASANDHVGLVGSCNVPGATIRLAGDVDDTVLCRDNLTWTSNAPVTTLGDGAIVIAATANQTTRFESRAAFITVTKQCLATGTTCGDGVLDPGEQCDQGCGNGNDRACTAGCKIATCGDGLLGPNEQCDQGNNNSDTGFCMANCQIQVCGNGVAGNGEQCDLGSNNSESGACTPECTDQVCGDGHHGANEQCDDGLANHSQTGTCTPLCTVQVCGDGFIGLGEECDAGAANADDGFCLPGCKLAKCGDGKLSPAETCDDGNTSGGDACPADCGVQFPFRRVSVGQGLFGCGLLHGTDAVACWGTNDEAFAGTPTGAFAAVTTGVDSTCGLRPDGTPACWGESLGQSTALTPPNALFSQLDAGFVFACGVKLDGTLACFGNPQVTTSGELVAPAGTFTQVSAGTHEACAVRTSGAVACWGDASNPPANAGTFTRVSVGHKTCGLRADHSLACWNASGITLDKPGPYLQIAAGSLHVCALAGNGQIDCFGANNRGQSTPPPGTWIALDAERDGTCAIRIDGAIQCWGELASPASGNYLP